MGMSFEEAFKNESRDLADFCSENHIIQYHSGGGNFHYAWVDGDEKFFWLIMMDGWDQQDAQQLPVFPGDKIEASLFIEDLYDTYPDADKVDLLEDFLGELVIEGLAVDSGNISITGLALKDALDVIEQVNSLVIDFVEVSE